jgi:hypothetical protein
MISFFTTPNHGTPIHMTHGAIVEKCRSAAGRQILRNPDVLVKPRRLFAATSSPSSRKAFNGMAHRLYVEEC